MDLSPEKLPSWKTNIICWKSYESSLSFWWLWLTSTILSYHIAIEIFVIKIMWPVFLVLWATYIWHAICYEEIRSYVSMRRMVYGFLDYDKPFKNVGKLWLAVEAFHTFSLTSHPKRIKEKKKMAEIYKFNTNPWQCLKYCSNRIWLLQHNLIKIYVYHSCMSIYFLLCS